MADIDSPTPAQLREALAQAESNLARASMKLGRLRSRSRGAPHYRDLTSVAFDVRAARDLIVLVLGSPAASSDDEAAG